MAIYKSDIVDINLETCNIHRAFLNRTIGSGDSGADHFGIRVFRDGEPVDLTGVSVQGIFLPPQGSPIAITDGNSVSGNEAYVVLPQACYNYDGQFCLSIKLVGGGVTGTMRIVDGMVDNTHSTGTVAPTETVPTYQEILSAYDDMVAATAAANGAIAKPYAQLTFPVKKGDYTIVDGALKRALVDIATSETYTAAHWTDAKLGPDVSALKSAIGVTTGNGIIDGFTWGKYINCSGSTVNVDSPTNSSSGYGYVVLNVSPGDVFTVNSIGGSNARAWCFIDSSGNVLNVAANNAAANNEIIIAPDDAAKLIINAKKTDKGSFYGEYVANVAERTKTELHETAKAIAEQAVTFSGITTGSSWTVGQGIAKSNGANFSDDKYCRTGYIQYHGAVLIYIDNDDYEFIVWEYSGSSVGSAVYAPKRGQYNYDPVMISNEHGGVNFRMAVRRIDGADIAASDVTALTSAIKTFAITDKTLTKSGVPADAKAVGDVKSSLDAAVDSIIKYGGIDLVTYLKTYSNATNNGIQYVWNADGSCTISGEATDNSFCNIVGSTSALLNGIIPGRKYNVDFHGGTIPVRLYFYTPSSSFTTHTENFDFTVPSDATAVLLRFQIASGTAFSEDVTVKYTVTMIDEGTGGGGTTINNTYNITTSPTITTDTNGWLAAVDTESSSDTEKTDMTGAIMSMLNDTGYCHLGEGIFYVSGSIDMPSGSMLEGCGKKTKLRLLSSVETGYVVRMREYCTLQNLEISGAYSASTPSTEGTRDGIWFEANQHDPEDVGEFTTSHCMISNVWIHKFSGSGLYCHNTSINYAKGIYVQNLYISYCYKGINIDYYSEFNKFTNVCISWCKIACVNNGGNNVFTACTFHATDTGFFIDGTQPNSAHGTLNGCTFCHIGSNSGKAIDMADITAGFIVSACQFWYNSINIKDSSGIVFSGCEFGRGTTGNGMNVNINGGGTVMFAGCMFNNDVSKPPVFNFTNDPIVKFSGCFGGASGDEIDPTAET